jgi:hypothetical protein
MSPLPKNDVLRPLKNGFAAASRIVSLERR